jgi:hypothetical protein
MSERDFEYNDDAVQTRCPECGEPDFLSPETGVCFDCEQELGLDEEEGDEDPCCLKCGDRFDSIDLDVHGYCEDCSEEDV